MRPAFRRLANTPGFSVLAIVVVALGIAANTAVFSHVEKQLLRASPFKEPATLARLFELATEASSRSLPTVESFLRWHESSRSFEHLGALGVMHMAAAIDQQPAERMRISKASEALFPTLRFAVGQGRAFAPAEYTPGRDHVVILAHRFWRTRFNADPGVIGRTITLNRIPHTIVGVLTADSTFDWVYEDIWTPFSLTGALSPALAERRLFVFGRLKPGVTHLAAARELTAIARRLKDEAPSTNRVGAVAVEPTDGFWFSDEMNTSALLLFGAVIAVQLIVCVNLANLLLARAVARRKEVAVRVALGATKGRLVRDFLGESLLLSTAGGVLGVVLAYWLAQLISPLMPELPARLREAPVLNLAVLGFAVIASTATGVVFGLLPAWHAANVNLNEVLKEGGRGDAGSPRGRRIGAALVVGEVALALALLVAAAVIASSFWRLRNRPLGFDPARVATLSFVTLPDHFRDNRATRAFYDQVVQRIAAVPGVTHVAVATRPPIYFYGAGEPFAVADRALPPLNEWPKGVVQSIDPAYGATLGVPLLKGRAFTAADVPGAPRVALINQVIADKYFRDRDPIGERLAIHLPAATAEPVDNRTPWQIVGVIGNIRNGGLYSDDPPMICLPFAQNPVLNGALLIRTQSRPAAFAAAIRQAAAAVNPDVFVTELSPLTEIVDNFLTSERNQSWLLGGFAAVALVLAALGLYGVLAYQVGQRTREFGVRFALGAQRSDVLRMLLLQCARFIGTGVALGLFGGYIVSRSIETLVYGTTAADLRIFAGATIALILVSILACWVPARRAMKVDPAEALRAE